MSDAKLLSAFPRTFWVANAMELLERAAYYGLNSVLAGYLTLAVAQGGLGFSVQEVGFLQGIVFAVTYVLPILGGALADRYGYRRMLMLAASLLSTGYFAAGQASTYSLIFLCLLLMATGAGLFKPIISGTIARTTSEQNSSVGFGIYYWMINIGAFLAPLIVSVLKGFSWRYVFIASSLYCAAMLLPIARNKTRQIHFKWLLLMRFISLEFIFILGYQLISSRDRPCAGSSKRSLAGPGERCMDCGGPSSSSWPARSNTRYCSSFTCCGDPIAFHFSNALL